MLLNRGYGRSAQAVAVKGQIEHRNVRSFDEVQAEMRDAGFQPEQINILLEDLRRDTGPEIEGEGGGAIAEFW